MKQTEFMNKDFYHTILDEGLFPNPDTVEVRGVVCRGERCDDMHVTWA